jgi:hypothetical protein
MGEIKMYKPKYEIGQYVKVEKYAIDKAVIIGVHVYVETINKDVDLSVSLDKYIESVNGCDYDIVFIDPRYDSLAEDTFSECYLDEWNND